MSDDSSNTESKSEFYPPYAEFSKTLRTWFVAYGIGGSVVLMTNENVWKQLINSECSSHIGYLFLIGGSLQVISAFANKHAMWHLYICEIAPYDSDQDKERRECFKKELPYKIAFWYSEQ